MGEEAKPVEIDETRKLSTDGEGAATPGEDEEPEAETKQDGEGDGDGGEQPTPGGQPEE